MKITQFFLTRKDFQIQKEGNPEIVLKNCHILLKKVVFLFFFFTFESTQQTLFDNI